MYISFYIKNKSKEYYNMILHFKSMKICKKNACKNFDFEIKRQFFFIAFLLYSHHNYKK